jgi:hypothetical protein
MTLHAIRYLPHSMKEEAYRWGSLSSAYNLVLE